MSAAPVCRRAVRGRCWRRGKPYTSVIPVIKRRLHENLSPTLFHVVLAYLYRMKTWISEILIANRQNWLQLSIIQLSVNQLITHLSQALFCIYRMPHLIFRLILGGKLVVAWYRRVKLVLKFFEDVLKVYYNFVTKCICVNNIVLIRNHKSSKIAFICTH